MSNKTALVVKQETEKVSKVLESMVSRLQMVLPPHLTPSRLIRITLAAVNRNPKLLDCERSTLYAAVMTCAQLGLEPDGLLGQAYLIPFSVSYKDEGGAWKKKQVVQFIPGYKGLITLARNSGEISEMFAREVRRNDRFSFDVADNTFSHTYDLTEERGDIIAFYAVAKFKDGGAQRELMSVKEVETIRDGSAGWMMARDKTKSPWHTHFPEMGKKTVIRRLVKYLPMNVQKLQMAAMVEDMREGGKHSTIDDSGDMFVDNDGVVIDGDAMDDVTPETATPSKLDTFASDAPPATLTPDNSEVSYSVHLMLDANTQAQFPAPLTPDKLLAALRAMTPIEREEFKSSNAPILGGLESYLSENAPDALADIKRLL